MQYAVVIEQANQNWCAHVPDLPGCYASGASVEQVKQRIAEAIEWHIAALKEMGKPIPEPTTQVALVDAQIQAA